ncbi:hypothetical protein D7Z54_22850 [Salibacterium salarium]|uniref:Uncharacterized protein n=1 Tax=Salibacterium salarium TaxID=284579 RepID=A0A3R9RAI6_9BACI|nr:hypothetical protein [Salibacterium salarium]RSL30988.1 hypothetical protein D7Z54_22850 [Salibacterium salarium]
MIWTLEPWLFYLLFSILILVIAFIIGVGLHSLLKKREMNKKKTESLLALGVALVMAGFYLFGSEMFTDRASEGQRIITTNGEERVEHTQLVIVPFGNYAVVERLYDFGYTVEDEIGGEAYRLTFDIENGPVFIEEFAEYVQGNRVFTNRSRIAFADLYDGEWKEKLQNASSLEEVELPGVDVEVENVS